MADGLKMQEEDVFGADEAEPTKGYMVRVPSDVHARWKDAAMEKGMSMNGLVNALLLAWLEKNGKKS